MTGPWDMSPGSAKLQYCTPLGWGRYQNVYHYKVCWQTEQWKGGPCFSKPLHVAFRLTGPKSKRVEQAGRWKRWKTVSMNGAGTSCTVCLCSAMLCTSRLAVSASPDLQCPSSIIFVWGVPFKIRAGLWCDLGALDLLEMRTDRNDLRAFILEASCSMKPRVRATCVGDLEQLEVQVPKLGVPLCFFFFPWPRQVEVLVAHFLGVGVTRLPFAFASNPWAGMFHAWPVGRSNTVDNTPAPVGMHETL